MRLISEKVNIQHMLKSMTAYGSARISTSIGQFYVEIQSVNRKFLEMNIQLPRELSRFESDVRKLLTENIGRGNITFRLNMTLKDATPISVVPNLSLARQLKQAWDEVATATGVEKEQGFSLGMIAEELGVLTYNIDIKDPNEYLKAIQDATKAALNDFIAMKIREGKELHNDIVQRLNTIEQLIGKIELKAPDATEKYRKKLTERLEELLTGSEEDKERITREICLFADKVDITEEITRFRSHIKQFRLFLDLEEGNGKKIEFLLQEFVREINTIASKSSDAEVSHLAVDIKCDLERIREQIQNIE